MVKRTLKCMLAVALTVTALAGPIRQAQAGDLAFPILFVPLYSQNTAVPGIAGAFTDTRIAVFNSEDPCLFYAPCPPFAAGTVLRAFYFGPNEQFITETSSPMTPFDVVVLGGGGAPVIPTGTGTAVLINTLAGVSPPVLAFLTPISAVVEMGVKTAGVLVPDGQGAGQFLPSVAAVVASEAQLIPAIPFGEFPRVEITAGPLGAPLLFPSPGFETVIVESCVVAGILNNFVVDDEENYLFDNLIPCTGIHVALVAGTPTLFGPDLVIWTPDDGALIAPGPGVGAPLAAGYNRLAIDVNGFGGVVYHGQAIVVMRGGASSPQAYSYNMPVNFFPFAFATPTAETTSLGVFDSAKEATETILNAVCEALNGMQLLSCESPAS